MKQKFQMTIVVIGLAFALLMVVTPVSQAGLPPRPTPTPVPSTAPVGATIRLQTTVGAWSVVQWQDVNGDWHNVDGWRGSVADGSVQWWVAEKDFDTGPFRWAMYQSDGSELTAASEAFYLPAGVNQTLDITAP